MDQVEGVFGPMLDSLVAYVADGISVHVVGSRGSGRSEMLRLAADRLDDAGSSVLRINGNAAWRHEPFAALTAAGIEPPPSPGARLSVRTMAAALAQRLRGQVVVVCEDADDIDPLSVGTLLAARQQRTMVAITSSRPSQSVEPGSLMVGLMPAVRVNAPVLGLEQVHDLVRRLLGGPVDAGTLARISMQSGGLYGLVVAMTSIGRRTGMLVERSGIWTAPGDLWTEPLATAVEPFLAGADEALWSGATILALAGPVALDQAEKLVEPADLERLFASDLVHHLTHDGITLVGVYPPLLAEYLRREGSPYELARFAGLIAHPILGAQPDAIGSGGADAAVLNQALLRQSADRAEAARATWSAAPTPEHAVALIDALRFSGASPAEIDQVITATRIEGEDVDSEAAAWYEGTVATWRAVGLNDLAAALAGLDAAGARLPSHAPMLRATREHVIFLRDRAPQLDAGTDPIVRIEVLIAAGRVDEARALLADFTPRSHSNVVQVQLYTGLSDVLAGDLHQGIEHAHRELNVAHKLGDPLLILGNAYVAVFGLLLAGRLADAAGLVTRTVSTARIASYREILTTGVLVWGAEIAISQGRFQQGRTLAAQALAADRGTGPFPGMVPAVLAGMDPNAPDDRPAQLWTLALDRLERGYAASAVTIAIEAVERSVDAAAAARIAAAAATMQGRLLPAAGSYLSAVAAGDVDLLAAARDAFDSTGAVFYAVRASVTRALLLRKAGRTREATVEIDTAWRCSTAAGFERGGLFHRFVSDVGLSARELEIVRMIARPMTTADVARALQMSVRTVETHLHNASRKLGTTGRDALTTAVTTWLSGA